MTTSEESDSFENVTHSMDCVLHWCHALVCMCVALEPCIGMCVALVTCLCMCILPGSIFTAGLTQSCVCRLLFLSVLSACLTGLYYRGTDSHAKISSTY